ncbi:hypothetical protein DFS33DRAFT_682987 [Desarmillaria ectypa]|nr:hypothetical protein DFS33DRAFT_682987 [Desarmillaria ectypa]
MSSKRGRKRNDNLPPNRARDVQRAFRARRAAHLQALEQRVTELEEENNCLRQALNLPLANRPALGKGPTGKDKPKTYELNAASTSIPLRSSRDSSSSPGSTRASSLSPGNLATTVPPRSVTEVEGGSWDQTLMINDQQSDVPSSSASSSYPLPPMNPPPIKQYASYTSPVPTSRNSLPSSVYISSQNSYSHSADRPVSSAYTNSAGFVVRDVRDEPRSHYSYSPQSSFHDNSMPSQSPPNTAPPLHSSSYHSPRETSLSYPPHRRSLTEPQQFSINQAYPHLPNPVQHGIRLPSPPKLQDSSHTHMSRNAYGPDGRINPIP